MLYVMFYVIMTLGPMVQHSMVGPRWCTPWAMHDDVNKLYGTLRLGKSSRNL